MKQNDSPEAIAQNFWIGVYREVAGRLENAIDGGEGLEEYIRTKRSLPEDAAVGGSKDLTIEHGYLVKPYMEWEKIKTCLKGIGITETALIERLVFLLKPYPLEDALSNPFLQRFEKATKHICRELNRKIKELSPLIRRLENLAVQDEVYHDFEPIRKTIEAFKFDVAVYKAIIKKKKNTDKKWAEAHLIDKDIEKVSPQKHKFWNVVIPPALEIVDRFCYTQEEAYRKIAELLKILYPDVWKGDIQTNANRIKQKNYKHLP